MRYTIPMLSLQRYWPVTLVAIILVAIVAITVRPYRGNVSALFHRDAQMETVHPSLPNFVILDVPGYDGMQYYQIARMLPMVADPAQWPAVAGTLPLSYAYQRILLPIVGYALAFGNVELFPWTFLLINLLSLIGVAFVMLRWKPEAKIEALALALSPAALIGLHFSLAEPITLLLLTLFLVRYIRSERIGLFDVLFLSLAVLAREVNILFIGLLLTWSLLAPQVWKPALQNHKWKNVLLLLIPIAVFLAWHSIIYQIFGNIPFLMSADKRTLPFGAIIDIFMGVQGYNQLTFSSMALFLGFVAPALLWLLISIAKKRRIDFLEFACLAFLGLMSMMAWHIWGSITSIGRVITPIYPLFLVYAATRRTLPGRLISAAILILGLAIGIALAVNVHPYHLT